MGGLLDSAKRAFDALLKAVETRLDLFIVELQEEKLRFVQIVLWMCGAVFFTAIGLIMFTFTVITLLGPDLLEEALIVFTVFYVVGAGVSFYKLNQMLRYGEKPFSATIDQLKRDQSNFHPHE